ncbi:MAG: hypothetical protein ACR5LF_01500 [Symbiopectobacterium sp.]
MAIMAVITPVFLSIYQYGVGVPRDSAQANQLLEKINAADIDIETTKSLWHTIYEAKAKAKNDAEIRAPILKYVYRYLNTANAETRRIFSHLGLSKATCYGWRSVGHSRGILK